MGGMGGMPGMDMGDMKGMDRPKTKGVDQPKKDDTKGMDHSKMKH